MSSKKIISYVTPQTLIKGKTSLGQNYEISFENGLKVLNSENTNYSFGSLHQIMLKGLDEVFKTNKPSNILMLGLGAGSALSVLKNKCKWPYAVTVVEIDSELIELAKQHFDLAEYDNLKIITGDALHEINALEAGSFDLIIDDVFWDDQIPDFCREASYLNQNKILLSDHGVYLRNTMKMSDSEHRRYERDLAEVFHSYYSVRHPVYGNKIYFCRCN